MLDDALTGVNPALVTPFTEHDEVDETAYRRVIRFAIDSLGVTGLVPAGSTGEFTSLSWDEQQKIIQIAIDEANGNVPVIAGTGTTGTKRTLELSQFATDIGADACIIVTPFYMKPSERGLFKHYSEIASKIDLPVVLYNIPILTAVTFPRTVVEDLADEYSNVVGIKDSSGNMSYLMELLERVKTLRSDFKILCGWDEIALPALSAGVDGLILASANFIGDEWIRIKKAIEQGRLGEARRLELEIHKITRFITKTGAAGTKAALNFMGIDVGRPRLPLEIGGSITYELREELRMELERIGKIEPRLVEVQITPEKSLQERFGVVSVTPNVIKDFSLKVGEALFGSGAEVAHVDLLLGLKSGPVGEAIAKSLASPVKGHEPLLALTQPNEKVKPDTLIVPTVAVRNMRQASMIFGPAQAAVAEAVVQSVKEGFIPKEAVDDLAIIANVFVHPSAVARRRVYVNNRKATLQAIRKAVEGRDSIDDLLKASGMARHPFKNEP
ncbi:MAG: 4-hydroxy-tetrahydrodipicolinate synthase [Candidatus Hodarchaeota archaeon]